MSQRVLKLMLQKLGHKVTTADNGKIAQEIYFQNPQEFSCVILDVEMPIQGGLVTCRNLRAHNKHLPIVMLTAHSTEKDKEESLEAGANLFLTKPVTINDLQLTLSKCVIEYSSVK